MIVPVYFEPSVHPFQLYNPQSFTNYASKFGVIKVLPDNFVFLILENEKGYPVEGYPFSNYQDRSIVILPGFTIYHSVEEVVKNCSCQNQRTHHDIQGTVSGYWNNKFEEER